MSVVKRIIAVISVNTAEITATIKHIFTTFLQTSLIWLLSDRQPKKLSIQIVAETTRIPNEIIQIVAKISNNYHL